MYNLAVCDAIGTLTISSAQIIVEIPAPEFVDDSLVLSTIADLSAAINSSNWKVGINLVNALTSMVRDRVEFSGAVGLVDDLAVVELVLALESLHGSLAINEPNTAVFISTFHYVISTIDSHGSWTEKHLNSTLNVVRLLVGAYGHQFGRTTANRWFSTTRLLELVAPIAQAAVAQGFASSLPDYSHVMQLFADIVAGTIVPGEQSIAHGAAGLYFQTEQRSTLNTTAIVIDQTSLGAVLSFDASQFQADTDFVGYHYLLYNGTFPNLPSNAYNIVTVFTVPSDSLPVAKRSALITAQVITNFTNVENISIATCATFDSTTDTWVTTGCTTNTDSSTVSCTCSGATGSPLTVLFGSIPSPPSGGSPSSGTPSSGPSSSVRGPTGPLSTAAIAAIAAVGGTLLIAAIIVAIVVGSRRCRKVVQPYHGTSGRSAKSRIRKMSRAAEAPKVEHDEPEDDL